MSGKAVVTAGVSYHHALTQPGQPLADFQQLDVHSLADQDMSKFDVVVVMRSVDNEALRARRHQVARFLDAGGVLVVFGEAWTNWFPGCRWEPECAEDLLPPIIANHPLLRGIAPDAVTWHAKGPSWCNHGHLIPPPGAEVLVANQRGDAWLYLDRASTNGVILAASNLDLDTHAFHWNDTARHLMHRVLAWAEREAAAASERRSRQARKIAGLFSGVDFQRGFYEDAEFAESFSIVPTEELGSVELGQFAALWVPRESNQAALMRHRERLEAYLYGGGTLVASEEINQPWLRHAAWEHRRVDARTLTLADHPLLERITLDHEWWHAHGAFVAPSGALSLVSAADGGAVLYIDERSYAPGRLLLGTLDPDCHIGYGSDVPRPLLRAILSWVQAGVREPAASGVA